MKQVLDTLRKHQLFAKISKCELFKQKVEYLRHYISADRISVDTYKIDAIKNWPIPSNISKLRSFLRLASYYWKFVKGFFAIATPLTKLLYKDQDYLWNKEQQEAFD